MEQRRPDCGDLACEEGKLSFQGYRPQTGRRQLTATLANVQAASTFGFDTKLHDKELSPVHGGLPLTNINFNFPQQQSYYIDFNNVYYYGSTRSIHSVSIS